MGGGSMPTAPVAPPPSMPATIADPAVAMSGMAARQKAGAAAAGFGGTVNTSGQGALAPMTGGKSLLGG